MFEMTRLVTVETHLILPVVTKDMPFLSTLVAFKLETNKPVGSFTFLADIIAPLASSTQVSSLGLLVLR